LEKKKELFIIRSDGISMFYLNKEFNHQDVKQKNESDNKANLTGGMITAILHFGKNLTKSDISKFDLGTYQIYVQFNEKYQVHYVIVEDNKEKRTEKAEETLNLVRNIFEAKYSDQEIQNWDGNLTYFDNFKENISKIIY
jgi:hypothetical protein